MLYINEYNHNGTTVLELEGRLDSDGALDLDATLHRACEQGSHQVLLEMSNVDFINSSGLRVLARFLKYSQTNACSLKLIGVTENVHRVMEIVGLDQFFATYDNIQMAMLSRK